MQTPPKENRFEFVVIAGKRARQLLAGALPRETGDHLRPMVFKGMISTDCIESHGLPRAILFIAARMGQRIG